MKDPKIVVSTSVNEALYESARLFTEIVSEASKKKERVSVALSGGKTPSGLFLLLSDRSEGFFAQIPWGQLDFFWSDERFVPADDKNSNFLMAKKTLLDRVPLSKSQIHRVVTENVSPEECAQAYQREIQNFFHSADLSKPPVFDLMLLGMGPDGHTASLFPDAPLEELDRGPFSDCWVKSFFIPHLKDEQPLRISFTPKLINASTHIIFLVTGVDKAEAFNRVLHSKGIPVSGAGEINSPPIGKALLDC